MVLFEIILWFDCYSSEPSEPRFYSRLLTTGTFPSNSVPGTQTTHKVHKTHFQVQGFKLEPPIEKNRSFKKLPSLQPCKIYSKIGHFFRFQSYHCSLQFIMVTRDMRKNGVSTGETMRLKKIWTVTVSVYHVSKSMACVRFF